MMTLGHIIYNYIFSPTNNNLPDSLTNITLLPSSSFNPHSFVLDESNILNSNDDDKNISELVLVLEEDHLLDLQFLSEKLNQIVTEISSFKSYHDSVFYDIFLEIQDIITEIYKMAYQLSFPPKDLLNISHQISNISHEICSLDMLYPFKPNEELIQNYQNQLKSYSLQLNESKFDKDPILSMVTLEMFSEAETIKILYPLCQHFHYYIGKKCNIINDKYNSIVMNVRHKSSSDSSLPVSQLLDSDASCFELNVDTKSQYSNIERVMNNLKKEKKIEEFNFKILYLINLFGDATLPNTFYFSSFKISKHISVYINFVELNKEKLFSKFSFITDFLLAFKDEISHEQ